MFIKINVHKSTEQNRIKTKGEKIKELNRQLPFFVSLYRKAKENNFTVQMALGTNKKDLHNSFINLQV